MKKKRDPMRRYTLCGQGNRSRVNPNACFAYSMQHTCVGGACELKRWKAAQKVEAGAVRYPNAATFAQIQGSVGFGVGPLFISAPVLWRDVAFFLRRHGAGIAIGFVAAMLLKNN